VIPNAMISSGLKQVRDISRQEASVNSERSKLKAVHGKGLNFTKTHCPEGFVHLG